MSQDMSLLRVKDVYGRFCCVRKASFEDPRKCALILYTAKGVRYSDQARHKLGEASLIHRDNIASVKPWPKTLAQD